MRTLASMTPAEVEVYMRLAGEATATITPPDGLFLLAFFGPDGQVHYASNANRGDISDALRELADGLDKATAEMN